MPFTPAFCAAVFSHLFTYAKAILSYAIKMDFKKYAKISVYSKAVFRVRRQPTENVGSALGYL